MHFVTGKQCFYIPPPQFRMLIVGSEMGIKIDVDFIATYDVMRADTGLSIKIVGIEVVVNAEQLARLGRDMKFNARKAFERVLRLLILADAAARHKPVVLRRPVTSISQKNLAHFITNDKVNRHEGRGLYYFQEAVFVEMHKFLLPMLSGEHEFIAKGINRHLWIGVQPLKR